MPEHLSGQAGIVQHESMPLAEQIQSVESQPLPERSGVLARFRNKWATGIATAAAVLAIGKVPGLEAQSAYAQSTETAVAGMPFQGNWAYNTPTSAACGPNSGQTSHPSCHEIYSGDWSTDLYDAAGTEVRLKVDSPTGTPTFEWQAASGSCGQSRRVKVKVDNVDVGWIYFTHLTEAAPTNNAPTNGMLLGKIANLSCNPGGPGKKHIHMEANNATNNNYSCYVNHSTEEHTAGHELGEGVALGVLGSSNNGAKQACTEVPTASHPPTRNNVNFTNGDRLEDIAWYETYPGTGVKPTLGALNAHGAGFVVGWKAPSIGPADWKGMGDFNGDKKTDIAWHEGTRLNIFLSNGSSYHKAISMPDIGRPNWAGVGDFNNDGKDDIAWHELYPGRPGTLKAFIANNAGTWLDVKYQFDNIGPATWAGVGDFNGDGKDDVAWHEGSTLSTITSTGNSWNVPLRNPNIGRPTWAQVGEFTGDNQDDIAWYEAGSSTLTVLPGYNGYFPVSESRRTRPIGPPKWAQVGDFNGDGRDDVAWFEQYPGYPNSLAAFLSDGARLNMKWKWAGGIGRPTWAGVGEFTGDNKEDLAWHEGSTLTIIRSNGNAWTVNDSHRTPNIGKPVWASRGDFPK